MTLRCGFGGHDDIRRALSEPIAQGSAGRYVDVAFMGTEEKRRDQNRALWGRSQGSRGFDAGGHYIITVMRSDRAKHTSNALWQGSPDENKETADGTITYFGTYSVSDADSSIAIKVEGSSFPNWNGTEQKRFVAIASDQLTLTVSPPGGDVVDVIWKRAK
jgi:Lipocalin-like domain